MRCNLAHLQCTKRADKTRDTRCALDQLLWYSMPANMLSLFTYIGSELAGMNELTIKKRYLPVS